MKKLLFVFALFAVLTTGTAFADHPGGFGIGIMGRYNIGWGSGGAALSLKIPKFPIYWGVNLSVSPDWFTIGVSGDYYFIDKKLVPEANLHWFLGGGGWFNFWSYTNRYFNKDYSYSSFALGARLPIGLSWQPIPLLEVFLDLAPSLGVSFSSEKKADDGHKLQSGGFYFPSWDCPLELGLRLWF